MRELAQFYCDWLAETLRLFESWNRDLLAVFRELRDAGVLEIIASRRDTRRAAAACAGAGSNARTGGDRM